MPKPAPTTWGATLYLNPDDTNQASAHIRERGVYDPGLTKWFQRHVEPGMTVIDVGAYIGYYTVLAAVCGASVLAFEPDPVTFDYLTRNVAQNGVSDRVTCRQAAVGDAPRTTELHVRPGGRAMNTLDGDRVGFPESVRVPVVTLDGVALQPDVIKLDAEGAEPAIIRGGRETIREYGPTIVMEWVTRYWSEPPEGTVDWLRGVGYRIETVEGDALRASALLDGGDTPANVVFRR